MALLAPGTQWSQKPIDSLPAACAVRTNGAAIMVADAAAVVATKRRRVMLLLDMPVLPENVVPGGLCDPLPGLPICVSCA